MCVSSPALRPPSHARPRLLFLRHLQYTRRDRWQVTVYAKGRSFHIGWFDDAMAAAWAFDHYALRFKGVGALDRVNFPTESLKALGWGARIPDRCRHGEPGITDLVSSMRTRGETLGVPPVPADIAADSPLQALLRKRGSGAQGSGFMAGKSGSGVVAPPPPVLPPAPADADTAQGSAGDAKISAEGNDDDGGDAAQHIALAALAGMPPLPSATSPAAAGANGKSAKAGPSSSSAAAGKSGSSAAAARSPHVAAAGQAKSSKPSGVGSRGGAGGVKPKSAGAPAAAAAADAARRPSRSADDDGDDDRDAGMMLDGRSGAGAGDRHGDAFRRRGEEDDEVAGRDVAAPRRGADRQYRSYDEEGDYDDAHDYDDEYDDDDDGSLSQGRRAGRTGKGPALRTLRAAERAAELLARPTVALQHQGGGRAGTRSASKPAHHADADADAEPQPQPRHQRKERKRSSHGGGSVAGIAPPSRSGTDSAIGAGAAASSNALPFLSGLSSHAAHSGSQGAPMSAAAISAQALLGAAAALAAQEEAGFGGRAAPATAAGMFALPAPSIAGISSSAGSSGGGTAVPAAALLTAGVSGLGGLAAHAVPQQMPAHMMVGGMPHASFDVAAAAAAAEYAAATAAAVAAAAAAVNGGNPFM